MLESHAEQLDPSVLGEQIGDEGRPGDDHPADEPMAVNDHFIVAGGPVARDDVAGRNARLHPESPNAGTAEHGDAPGLIDSSDAVSPTLADEEPQLLADPAEEDGAEVGPEAAAMRIVEVGE